MALAVFWTPYLFCLTLSTNCNVFSVSLSILKFMLKSLALQSSRSATRPKITLW